MKRKPVDQAGQPAYPTLREYRANRREFLTLAGIGLGGMLIAGCDSGNAGQEPPTLAGIPAPPERPPRTAGKPLPPKEPPPLAGKPRNPPAMLGEPPPPRLKGKVPAPKPPKAQIRGRIRTPRQPKIVKPKEIPPDPKQLDGDIAVPVPPR